MDNEIQERFYFLCWSIICLFFIWSCYSITHELTHLICCAELVFTTFIIQCNPIMVFQLLVGHENLFKTYSFFRLKLHGLSFYSLMIFDPSSENFLRLIHSTEQETEVHQSCQDKEWFFHIYLKFISCLVLTVSSKHWFLNISILLKRSLLWVTVIYVFGILSNRTWNQDHLSLVLCLDKMDVIWLCETPATSVLRSPDFIQPVI